jgi:diguanylate cyclase (GGDEF)-like protein
MEADTTGWVDVSVKTWAANVHPEDVAQVKATHTAALRSGTTYKVEYRVRDAAVPDGHRWLMSFSRIVRDEATDWPLRVVGLDLDITERKIAEQRIAYMACHDVLTGLPNRTVFREHLEQRLSEVRRGRGQAALLCLDLDRFKSVNDTLGHLAGDDLLRQIASRLKATLREGDVLVRLGGDEFAIIVSYLDHSRQASMLAQRVIDAVGQPLDLGGHLVTVGVTVGIAFAPSNGDTPDTLFKNADLALYRAKASARNTYCFYEAGMDAAVERRMQLEFEMREAVVCGDFALHYQPVLRLADQQYVGFEALMRWPHPTRGMISPGDFIPLAEETGQIVPLGAWALREACREAASWPSDLRVAVNVSAVQFRQPGLEQSVVSALAASGLAPHRLELEITESVLVQDAEAVIACLHRLRSLGVRIALDDFGTGYSSLSYLRRFPFDKIKIDRSFIREISDPDAAAIVRAVVGIATHLGASVTAEGVETAAQLQQVRQEGCTEVQGFLISRPLLTEQAMEFARGERFGAAA